MPFGFALAAPAENNAGRGLATVAPFIGTGSSLAFAALAAKHNIDNPGYAHKSFYYIAGLTEGRKPSCCLCCAACFWRTSRFSRICALCWLTTTTRIWSGYLTLRSLTP